MKKYAAPLMMLVLFGFAFSSAPHVASAQTGNLVQNGTMEVESPAGFPQNFGKGRWGTNTTTFQYPITGQTGKGAKVSMTARTSGDAKWYFPHVAVTPGSEYEFKDHSRSNVTTFVTVEFKRTDGTLFYQDIGTVPASATAWQLFTKKFTIPAGVTSLTVFHVINSVGFLDTDNVSLVKQGATTDPTLFDKGYISFTFDDGHRSDVDVVLPKMEAAGFLGTFFIVTSRIHQGDFPGFIKTDEILDLQARGFEIGAHTRTHRDLTTISLAAARQEINGSRQDLLNIGVTPLKAFAYPFGAYNNAVRQAVIDAGFAGARSSDGGINKRNQDKYTLKRQPVKQGVTLAAIKADIDKALAEKTWLILMFHEIDNSGGEYSTTPQMLQQIIDYVKSKNVTPITIAEGIAKMQ